MGSNHAVYLTNPSYHFPVMPRPLDDSDYTPAGPRERRLAAARPKRTRKAARAGAPVVAARPRRAEKSELRRQIERGLNGDTAGSSLTRQIAYVVRDCSHRQIAVAREMLYALERRGSILFDHPTAAAGVVRLARFHEQFQRPPATFEPTGDTPHEQFRRLANHLFERWAVPRWIGDAWLTGDAREQQWFVHLGAGRNLADAPGLPYPLTKRMAHFAINAPRGLDALQALRWGQLRGFSVPEELCAEAVHTRLRGELPDEPFWKTVAEWLGVQPEVYGHTGVLVDYVFAQRVGDFARPEHPGFTIRGRDPDRLLADARAWHDALHRRRAAARGPEIPARWRSCGIAGFLPTPPPTSTDAENQKGAGGGPVGRELPSWAIVELLTADDLSDEGAALHHCVGGYVAQTASGDSAIFSLRRRAEGIMRPSVTIEVWPAQRRIVQARGQQNAQPNADDQRLIETWAKTQGLGIESFVFGQPMRRGERR